MRVRLLAELIGTFAIVAAVLGAGFMVSDLSAEPALGLLMIASAVAGVLFVAIATLAPVSGAHFNPIVSLAFWSRKELSSKDTTLFIGAQLLGALLGAIAANAMFNQLTTFSNVDRFSFGSMIGEAIASAGLVFLILQLVDNKKENLVALAVALWIFAGHLFTSSTAFANPAVTLGRVFSSAPSSISIDSALQFFAAQAVGLVIALFISSQFRKARK